MHRLVRIGIVTAVAICVGTAALAVAENNRYPSAKQIPTVVTGPSGAAAAAAIEPAIVAPPSAVVPEQSATPSEAPSPDAATIDEGQPESGPTAPAASSPMPKVTQETAREVVTRSVRDEDDGDGHTSDSQTEGSKRPSGDSQKTSPSTGDEKD
jgi:hypothetical protein